MARSRFRYEATNHQAAYAGGGYDVFSRFPVLRLGRVIRVYPAYALGRPRPVHETWWAFESVPVGGVKIVSDGEFPTREDAAYELERACGRWSVFGVSP